MSGASERARARAAQRTLLCAAALWTGACGDEAPACRFGSEHTVFQSEAQEIHALAVVPLNGATLALFSDSRGLHGQWLTASGSAREPARSIAPACDAGLDAVREGEHLLVACARRPGQDAALGALILYTLDPSLTLRATQTLATIGPASHGVALARSAAGLAVLWHDAALSGESILFAELAPAGTVREIRKLSDPDWDASAPGLTASHGRLYAVWAETQHGDGVPRSRVKLSEPNRQIPARVVIKAHDPAPSPRLIEAPPGLILAYRDKRETARKPGLYLARLDLNGQLEGNVVRAGRADGEGAPALSTCLGGVVSATPRTFAGDYFVGVTWADVDLRRLTEEQQFYEDSREFDRVAMHCGNSEALLLIAERGRLLESGAALRSTTLRCQ